LQRKDSLRLSGVAFVWIAAHALIPAAAVAYPVLRFVRAILALVRFSFAGSRVILAGILARVARLSPKRREIADAQKKFAFVSHVLPPEWSGQSVMIKRLLEAIDPSGYCLISSHDYSADPTGFIGRLPGTYYWLPPEWQMCSYTNYAAIRWLNLLTAVMIRGFRIAYMLVALGCRTVIAASGDPVDLPAAYVAARITGARFVPYLFDDYTYQWPADDGRKEAQLAESIMFRSPHAIIVPNEFLELEIGRRHPNARLVIVRNPTDELPVVVRPDGGKTISTEAPGIITYTGAIYHVNFGAFRNLISAIDKDHMPPLELHLYVAQSMDWLAERGISSSRIVLHGHVPPEEVRSIQEQSDILFLGFAFDSAIPELITTSAPGKLGDYLATGVPILAHVPPDCFVAWYLREHECGIVVNEDDPARLAEAIRNLLTDPVLCARLHKNALERAQRDFHPSTARKAFLSVLDR
jgi:glycosyltransferase involved in cell wall biosynthesis